jgi:hypothetical protein
MPSTTASALAQIKASTPSQSITSPSNAAISGSSCSTTLSYKIKNMEKMEF